MLYFILCENPVKSIFYNLLCSSITEICELFIKKKKGGKQIETVLQKSEK